MGQGLYKVGQPIEVTYQATKAQTGLDDVKMDVYDEAHAIDVAKGIAAMTEIGATGRYYGAFTPDAEGEWQVHIDSATKSGKVIKQFSVTAHNIDSVGDAVATADGKIDTVDTVVDAIKVVTDAESGTKAAVATADGKIDTVDTVVDAIKVVTDAESGVKVAVDGLENVSKAEVQGEVDTALATYDAPTKAELDAAKAALQGVDGDTLETLSDQIDNVASADSAPMIG